MAAIRAGDDIKTEQGNPTASFTLDVYGHITEEMKKDSANQTEDFIRGISNL